MKTYAFYGWETANVTDERGLTPRDHYDLLSRIWCADTCAPRMRERWSPEDKTLGQCSITAFLMQDIFGGDVYGVPLRDGNFHCFNDVGGCVFDLTSEQFKYALDYENCPLQNREVHFAKAEKRRRYEYLKARLEAAIAALEPGAASVFESEKLLYAVVSEALVGDYLAMMNDFECVGRFISAGGRTYFEADEIEWVRKKREANDVVFSMLEKTTGEFVGNVELVRRENGETELGIAITAAKQDRGYGTEAVAAIVGYGFGRLGLRRIILRARPYNPRALRVYEKCGFREYARDADHVYMEIAAAPDGE